MGDERIRIAEPADLDPLLGVRALGGCGPDDPRAPGCSSIPIGIGRGNRALVLPKACPPPAPPTREELRARENMRIAVVEAFKAIPYVVTQPSPLCHPGDRGRRNKVTKTVIFRSASAATAQINAGVFMRDGVAGPLGSTANPTIVTAAAGASGQLLSYTLPDFAQDGYAESFLVTCQSLYVIPYVLFSAWVSGQQVQPEFSLVDMAGPIPIQAPLQAGETISIQARALSTAGVWVLGVQLNFWVNPVDGVDDTLRSMILAEGRSAPRTQECD